MGDVRGGGDASSVPLFETRDLAIYASIIGTLDGAWTLYHGIFRDRPRVGITVYEGVDIYGGDDRVLMIRVWNRGRRDFAIDTITRQVSLLRGTRMWIRELAEAVAAGPDKFGDGGGHTYMLGPVGYTPGKIPFTRWFVMDGVGRIYPLRERFRQRVERVVLWPLRRFLRWEDSRARRDNDDGREDDGLIDV